MNISAIILAAGKGTRMNLGFNKMFLEVDGVTIIEHSVYEFSKIKEINQIIVVVNQEELTQMQDILRNYHVQFCIGGNKRYQSVYQGLQHVDNEYVLIHDGARCYVSEDLINRVMTSLKDGNNAVCLGVPSKDTIHYVDENNYINKIIDRNQLYIAQTPQGFKTSTILKAYDNFLNSNKRIKMTDDAMIVKECTKEAVKIVQGEYYNIKVTTQDDI
ncbi:MAG: 2-C-methyl-D-erythritol 4-phosphate cytidylyltransferase [Bacilli bacterium]|jgi:2-C-methyl-D-erythritol 4-phosphate cytidylyltransferase|nr:2-C-methyl-D-erythritol 4-phosphate cytidylyltransferase [Bacilli bacterium]